MNVFALLQKAPDAAAEPLTPTLDAVYRSHAEFVWGALQRFGIRGGDLDDALQEVFVVVHRKLPSYRGEGQMTTWLYGICLRVASAHRRRSHTRRERDMQEIEEVHLVGLASPEDDLAEQQRRQILERLLDELDVEKRALLVMFEIDELSCEEIADILGVPMGTVYSRLHGARKAFAQVVARFRLRAGRTKGERP